MIKETIVSIGLISTIGLSSLPLPFSALLTQKKGLAQRELDLTNRLPDKGGSQIFADNILLAIHYRKGDAQEVRLNKDKPIDNGNIDWEKLRQPFTTSFTLKPGQMFAYHANALPEYKDSVVYTMNSRFFMEEGYKSLGGLGGNGVCHLASLINWAAAEAGLEVVSKVNHDFYPVPGVPRENGTSILYAESGGNSQNQNLYIRNKLEVPVTFEFKADNQKVILTITN